MARASASSASFKAEGCMLSAFLRMMSMLCRDARRGAPEGVFRRKTTDCGAGLMRSLSVSRYPASCNSCCKRGSICRSLACCAVFRTRMTISPFSRRRLRMSETSMPALIFLAAGLRMRAMRRTSKSSSPSVSGRVRSKLICAKERALARVMRTLADMERRFGEENGNTLRRSLQREESFFELLLQKENVAKQRKSLPQARCDSRL